MNVGRIGRSIFLLVSFVLAAAVVAALIVLTTGDSPSDGEWANQVCRERGGVIQVSPETLLGSAVVTCRDGHAQSR